MSSFNYQDFYFRFELNQSADHYFQSRVFCIKGPLIEEAIELLPDTAPYRTEAKALRHAEQHAVRWVHDRSGDPRGQF